MVGDWGSAGGKSALNVGVGGVLIARGSVVGGEFAEGMGELEGGWGKGVSELKGVLVVVGCMNSVSGRSDVLCGFVVALSAGGISTRCWKVWGSGGNSAIAEIGGTGCS